MKHSGGSVSARPASLGSTTNILRVSPICSAAMLANEEHIAMVLGEPAGEGALVRVHSSCFTGEVLGSLRCDCRAQLDAALARIGREGRGVVVYLVQEGRGIGLGNKVRAYQL